MKNGREAFHLVIELHHPRPASATRSLYLAMVSFWSVCSSNQPWALGPARLASRKGCPDTPRLRPEDRGVTALPGCLSPCSSEEVSGAIRFLQFCTVFLCIHFHFYLITDLLVALISEFKACEKKIKKLNCPLT